MNPTIVKKKKKSASQLPSVGAGGDASDCDE